MNDGFFRAVNRLEGAINEFFPRLYKDLNRHVIGDTVLFNKSPNKRKFGIRG